MALLAKAVGTAVKELNQQTPNCETLVNHRELILHMHYELGDIEGCLRELGGGEAVQESWRDAQMIANEAISNTDKILSERRVSKGA